VSPEEESDMRAIERAVGKRIPRVMVSGFDYGAPAAERLEIPLAERIAAIRAQKAIARARARARADRPAAVVARPSRSGGRTSSGSSRRRSAS